MQYVRVSRKIRSAMNVRKQESYQPEYAPTKRKRGRRGDVNRLLLVMSYIFYLYCRINIEYEYGVNLKTVLTRKRKRTRRAGQSVPEPNRTRLTSQAPAQWLKVALRHIARRLLERYDTRGTFSYENITVLCSIYCTSD